MIEVKNIKCDIYVGRSAGEELHSTIRKAKKSVRIVSPYLSASLVTELIALHQRNIEVELVTSDNIEDYYDNKNIYQLLIQNKKVNHEKKQQWNNLIKWRTYLFFAGVVLTLFSIFKAMNSWHFLDEWPYFVVSALFFISAYFFTQEAGKIVINDYYYSQLFPFTVIHSQYQAKNGALIHSKIYIIDDEIAYLGSLNYTFSGANNNHETRIKIEDPIAIEKLKEEIDYICTKSHFPIKDIQEWGRSLYKEFVQ